MSAFKNVPALLVAAGVLVTSTAALAGPSFGPWFPKPTPKPAAAPELAGKGAPAALALIAAGAAIVVSRRRRAA